MTRARTRVRIATRGSDLALAQARGIARDLEEALGVTTELCVIRTSGDRIQDVSLAKIGGKGLFVKEIEAALLADEADLAVHSAKDLPAHLAPGLALVAFPPREDPRDALVAHEAGATLDALAPGARVGTGSARRRSQLLAYRPDLEVVPLRGNVPTRLRKLEDEKLDAVVLACAGLVRLGLADRIHERIAPEAMLPAVGQGTLGLQMRTGDPLASEVEAGLGDPEASIRIRAERAFLERLEGDCNVPLAAYALVEEDSALSLRTQLLSVDGDPRVSVSLTGSPREAEDLGRRAADRVLAEGGAEILERLKREAGP